MYEDIVNVLDILIKGETLTYSKTTQGKSVILTDCVDTWVKGRKADRVYEHLRELYLSPTSRLEITFNSSASATIIKLN